MQTDHLICPGNFICWVLFYINSILFFIMNYQDKKTSMEFLPQELELLANALVDALDLNEKSKKTSDRKVRPELLSLFKKIQTELVGLYK